MAINQPNPQRGTGVRKPGTSVRPNPAAPPAAPSAGVNRPTSRRLGAPAPSASRPPLRSSPPPRSGGSGANKIIMIVIILLLAGMVAYGFLYPRKDANGNPKPPLFIALANKYGFLKAKGGAEGADPSLPDLDRRFRRALDSRNRAKTFLDDQQKFADAPDKLTEVERKRVVDELEKFRDEVESGTDDLARVAAAEGKNTSIAAGTAKEEQKAQKAFAMELGKALIKWKGPKEAIFAKASAPEFVANKFSPPKTEEKKPEEKKDPRRGETVVAPANPSDIPKPPAEPAKPKEEPKGEPEKPKEEAKPKPAESKPEPEKPKPEPAAEKPKPEPEKPKEVAKADPEKPKPEPAPAPEKPKPEPEKPKAEPEKPKEEPKAEPKPEPKPEKKVETVMAEADKLIIDGTPLAKDVIAASRTLPSDPEQLKTLLMKLETAQSFFVKARESYSSLKDEASVPADLAAKLAKIEKILSILQNAADGIKSKMK